MSNVYCKKSYWEFIPNGNHYCDFLDKCYHVLDEHHDWLDDILNLNIIHHKDDDNRNVKDYIMLMFGHVLGAPSLLCALFVTLCLFFFAHDKEYLYEKNKWYSVNYNGMTKSYYVYSNKNNGNRYFHLRKYGKSFNKYFIKDNTELRREKLKKLRDESK